MRKFTVKVVGSATFVDQFDEGVIITVTNRAGRIWATKAIKRFADTAGEEAQMLQEVLDGGDRLDPQYFEEVFARA